MGRPCRRANKPMPGLSGISPEPMASAAALTVITLCRNNPQPLELTLAALPEAVAGLPLSWELLVVDGSEGPVCALAAQRLAVALDLPLRLERRPARGIYAAMNEALVLAEGELLAFMHAGDRYRPGGLTALVRHWLAQGRPEAVFGQAWVIPPSAEGALQPWLTPDPVVRRPGRWLQAMVPCHQAFVFEAGFARAHPYAADSLVADRAVMRAALAAAGPGAYLPQPVCDYDLSGMSSTLPDGRELWRRLRDRRRSWLERGAEPLKALLRPGWAASYPRLMRWRSAAWGWCCR